MLNIHDIIIGALIVVEVLFISLNVFTLVDAILSFVAKRTATLFIISRRLIMSGMENINKVIIRLCLPSVYLFSYIVYWNALYNSMRLKHLNKKAEKCINDVQKINNKMSQLEEQAHMLASEVKHAKS